MAWRFWQGMLKPTLDYADFKDVDMVIEAVPEIMDLKKEALSRGLLGSAEPIGRMSLGQFLGDQTGRLGRSKFG